MDHPFIFEIGDILVSSEILTEYFSCDYESCGGCCCIIGDSGAPVGEDEVELLESNFKNYIPYMTRKGITEIKRQGFAIRDYDNDLVTPLVEQRECAYCCFNGNEHCFCAIEKGYLQNGGNFRKPVSCSLYPIRASSLSNGKTALNLHRWSICSDGYLKGRREQTRVFRFLREPITRAYGEEFYSALEAASKSLFASI